MRPICVIWVLLLAACSRPTSPRLEFELSEPGALSLTLSNPAESRVLLRGVAVGAGSHRLEIAGAKVLLDGQLSAEVPEGSWQWQARTHQPFRIEERGSLGRPEDSKWPIADGPPASVSVDERGVYIGSHAGEGAGAIVALDAEGRWRWSHQRAGLGVQALACDAGVVYVLADAAEKAGGHAIYKLDAGSGQSVAWAGRQEVDLPITSLWSDPDGTKAKVADEMAVANGRIYLSFTTAGFIAILNSTDGSYVTTLSAPEPTQLALSLTPIKDSEGREAIADFGIAVLGHSALSFFLMPHDPPWVAANNSHWLDPQERIRAFTMHADTMRTGQIDLYLALGAPQAQVQMRSGGDPRGFLMTFGSLGGRTSASGPWDPQALREVCSLASDSRGQLWALEADRVPRRVTVWKAAGKRAELVEERILPNVQEVAGAAVFPGNPSVIIAAGCEWSLDLSTGQARCVGVITERGMEQVSFIQHENQSILVVADRHGLAFYERRAPGDWIVLAQCFGGADSAVTYWADLNGDGESQPDETQVLPIKDLPRRALASGTLVGPGGQYPLLGWSPFGGPTFAWDQPVLAPAPGSAEPFFQAMVPETNGRLITRTSDGRAWWIAEGLKVMEIVGASSERLQAQGQLPPRGNP